MKYLLFIALLLPSFLWAQEKVKHKKSIQIITGIGIGHHAFNYGFKEELLKPLYAINRSCSNCIEPPIVGGNWRFGIDYQHQIIEGLYLKVGGRFAMWRGKEYYRNRDHDRIVIGRQEFYFEIIKPDNYYVEMPFILQYKFGQKKVQFYVEAGITPMFSKCEYESILRPFSVAIQTGVGLSYQINNRYVLFGQLYNRVQVRETMMGDHYGNLSEIGLELGIGFDF